MNPNLSYDLARMKMADLQGEADRERLAATAKEARRAAAGSGQREPVAPRWVLRRLFARLVPAGSGA
jgi:hypothetical protein